MPLAGPQGGTFVGALPPRPHPSTQATLGKLLIFSGCHFLQLYEKAKVLPPEGGWEKARVESHSHVKLSLLLFLLLLDFCSYTPPSAEFILLSCPVPHLTLTFMRTL